MRIKVDMKGNGHMFLIVLLQHVLRTLWNTPNPQYVGVWQS